MRIKKITALMALLLIIASLFCGCRYSPTLEQIINERHKTEINYNNLLKPVSNQPDNDILSDVMPDLTTDESSKRYEDTVTDLALAGDKKNNALAGNTKFDEDSELNEKAENTPGGEQTMTDNSSPNDGKSGDTSDNAADTSVNQDEIRENAEGEGGTGESGTFVEASSNVDTAKQVVDAYGNLVEIPENVSCVSAVGDLAVMVMMLGGVDCLAATSHDLVANDFTCEVFAGLADVPVCWRGNGSAGISKENFAKLLKLRPDVCLEVSGSATFSEDQVQSLIDEGIVYLVLPAITDKDSLEKTMTTIGLVLGDKSADNGINAPALAAEYNDWSEKLFTETSDALDKTKGTAQSTEETTSSTTTSTGTASEDDNSQTYTMFIDAWDKNAYYKIANEKYVTMSGYGVAIVRNISTDSCKAVSNFLSYAGVSNATAAADAVRPRRLYFIPLVSYSRNITVNGNDADELSKIRMMDVGGGLGTSTFPALVVSSKEVAQQLQNSKLWYNYGRVYSRDGNFYADGFLDENGIIISTQVSGAYQVYVNPRGASSWTNGSCESVLESVWAAGMFHGIYTEQEIKYFISEFYLLFYNYRLSETQLDDILAGA